MLLYTIGHSNRPLEEFLAMLENAGITHLIDIRTLPKSRFVPWSNQKALAATLEKHKIKYTHMPELGGMRHPQKDSINQGWKNAGFRGFADYMQTPEFFQALKALNNLVKNENVVIMCAEAVPWRCHRSLISDAEIVHHVKVIHLINTTSSKVHELTAFAVIDKTTKPIKISYPEDKNFTLPL